MERYIDHGRPRQSQVQPEMEKRSDTADISVLFFFGCSNILAVYVQCTRKLAKNQCAPSTVLNSTVLLALIKAS